MRVCFCRGSSCGRNNWQVVANLINSIITKLRSFGLKVNEKKSTLDVNFCDMIFIKNLKLGRHDYIPALDQQESVEYL